ncbi:hypothetical protein GJ699_14655 [Duganella sp. FT80W]|uniref:Uncharacterized protein n=1 Tax=Duganella guangzhouensis TaxID=2666084 RepID=A0A6I2L099_9BURK|nr:hypothetical protein [Duganella guangzhouensis]MRW91232.1 hypothetical protein [Duganella guangzhouensis]
MKTQWLLGTLLCATLCVQAQENNDRVMIPAPRLSIDLPARHYFMERTQMKEFRGEYTLSNGQTLTLSGNDYAMYAEVSGQGKHKLVAANRNTFVALDRKIKVQIDRSPDGDIGGEVLMAVPARMADSGEMGETVVRLATR